MANMLRGAQHNKANKAACVLQALDGHATFGGGRGASKHLRKHQACASAHKVEARMYLISWSRAAHLWKESYMSECGLDSMVSVFFQSSWVMVCRHLWVRRSHTCRGGQGLTVRHLVRPVAPLREEIRDRWVGQSMQKMRGHTAETP